MIKNALAQMYNYVHNCIKKECKLEFNQKSQIMPLAQGVNYLSFRFYLKESGKVIKRLRSSNKKRMKRKLKNILEHLILSKQTAKEREESERKTKEQIDMLQAGVVFDAGVCAGNRVGSAEGGGSKSRNGGKSSLVG